MSFFDRTNSSATTNGTAQGGRGAPRGRGGGDNFRGGRGYRRGQAGGAYRGGQAAGGNRGGQAGGAYRGGQAAGGYRGGRGGAAGLPRDKAFIVTALQDEVLDMDKVQQHSSDVVDSLSNESYKRFIPMFLGEMIPLIGEEYERYRRLIVDMMLHARQLLFQPTLAALFLSVVEGNAFREVRTHPALEGLLKFAKSGDPDENAERLSRAVSTALVELPQQQAPSHQRPQYNANESYENVGPVAGARDVVPTAEDLMEDVPPLTEEHGVVIGAGIDDAHCSAHLRVLHDLMRADCLHSAMRSAQLLRQIVMAMGDNNVDEWRLRKDLRKGEGGSRAIKVYTGITCSARSLHPSGVFYYIFSIPRKSRVRDRSFMTGNLVMWSAKFFSENDAVYIGVVVSVPGKHDDNYIFGVELLSHIGSHHHAAPAFGARWHMGTETFTFIESTAFFKPYRAAMKRLREMRDTIPLQPAILRGETATPPEYVLLSRRMNIGDFVALKEGSPKSFDVTLLGGGAAEGRDDMRYDVGAAEGVDDDDGNVRGWDSECLDWTRELEDELRAESKHCHVLDHTQRSALHHIFTHRVAIVQGTPGTGKTFLGTKFVQILLNNRDAVHSGPILCMAFTNHAVDAFLEDIVGMSGEQLRGENPIVRLGRGTRNEKFKQFEFNGGGPSRDMRDILDRMGQLTARFRNSQGLLESRTAAFAHIRETLLVGIAKDMRVDVNDDVMGALEELDACTILKGIPRRDSQKLWTDVAMATLKEELKLLRIRANAGENTKPETEYYEMIRDTITYLMEGRFRDTNYMRRLWEYFAINQDISLNMTFNWWLSLPEVVDIRGIQIHPKRHLMSTARQLRSRTELPAEIKQFLLASYQSTNSEAEGAPEEHDEAIAALAAEERQRRFNAEAHYNGDNDVLHIDTSRFSSKEDYAKMEAFINNHTPQHSTHANDNNRVEHLLSLSLEDRRLLHQAVMAVAKYRTAEEISSILESPATAVTIENSRAEIQRRDARVLRNAKVIVGTTDSVMTHLSALQNAGIRVMVVEEAAEVLESHVLASMTENLEHLVLIGDHKQLRPKANEMELELKKGLCVSLQERLILCGAPFETLTMQRRMHPVISRIVHPYYARDEQPGDQPVVITDHPRTELIEEPLCVGVGDRCYRTYMVGYEKEKGVREEQLDPKIESPGNRYECDVVSGIVRHLLRYHRDKSITVLVPYTGQLLWIKEKLKDLQQTILCRTVDDFQGEESDFVVLSLTRTERAGFLVHENRACVALSRARMGCYLVGCTDVVRRASPLLGHFVSLMEQDGTLGDSFPARCPTHKHEFAFRSLKDYDQLICRDKCAYVMECHHACERICHEGDHAKCQKPCERVGPLCKSVQARSCKHPCKKKCHEHCGPCHVRVPYTCPDCGASFEVACYELDDTSKIKCRNSIVLLTTADSPCGHEVSGMCWQRREVAVDADKFVQKHCKQKCEQHMPCGHLCPRKCHCGEDDLHYDQTKRCHALCTAKHPICGHMVERKCSSDPKDAHSYSRCEQVCGKVSAIHGCACRLKCGHTGSCDCGTEHVKKCERCQDSKNVKCGDYSSFVCPSPCTYKLLCGHVCPGHCGECAGSSSRVTDEPTFMSHQRCANKCKHIHPCGHACQDGCDVKCGPCMVPCDFSCGHGQPHRGHACSDCPARHCQEPCQWSCKHHTCTLHCHEPCTRPVCDEQCDKKLPCGHRCFGLCGERCPRFCPQCYRDGKEEMKALRDMITMDFLPDDEAEAYASGVLPSPMEGEEEVDFRMVEMPCCGVLTTVGFLDRHLLSFAKPDAENVDNRSVACKVPRCPWCNDTVMPNYYNRRRAIVCASHQLLMNVNKHIKKTDDENRKTCQEAMLHLLKATEHKSVNATQDVLTALWNSDKSTSRKNPKNKREAAKQLSQKVSNAITLMKVDLTCPKISYPCYETMIDWLFGEEASDRRDSSIYVVNSIIHLWQWHDTLDMSDKHPTWGADSIKAYCLYMLRNHMASSLAESLALTVEWLCMMSSAHHLQLTSRMLDTLCEANARFFPANKILLPEKCFLSGSVMRQMREELKQAWPLVHAELASHRDRLKLFTKALGVTAGHWYECANGHVYVIGDCGGAMERATCPECGGAIGGEQHAVDRTNRSAAHRVERGARPAWPQGHML